MKIAEYSPGINTDGLQAEVIQYNGSYDIEQGPAQADDPLSGKGYALITYTEGPTLIGVNDVDDENPNFVDPNRTARSG